MGKDDHIPDDKVLAIPSTDGDDVDVQSQKSSLLYQRQLDEYNHEIAGDTLPRMLFPWTEPRRKSALRKNIAARSWPMKSNSVKSPNARISCCGRSKPSRPRSRNSGARSMPTRYACAMGDTFTSMAIASATGRGGCSPALTKPRLRGSMNIVPAPRLGRRNRTSSGARRYRWGFLARQSEKVPAAEIELRLLGKEDCEKQDARQSSQQSIEARRMACAAHLGVFA
jgi:hypothetical protein